jgi:hypothetical protein
MRITNRSKVTIDRALWWEVARRLRLDGELPEAFEEGVCIYDAPELSVHLHRENSPVRESSYSMGRIEIRTCRECTPGRLFHDFCHEIAHAWIGNYAGIHHFEEASEEVAEAFADHVYEALGGAYLRPDDCRS